MLRYKINPYERAFTFQILSQDKVVEDAINSIGGSFVSSNGWTICAKNSPELKVVSKRIFLRGKNTSRDMRIDRTWNFKSNYARDLYMSEVDKALAEVISFAREYEDSKYYTRYGWDMNEQPRYDYWRPFRMDVGNWTSEVQPTVKSGHSVHIDANGWGNNKPRNNNLVYVV